MNLWILDFNFLERKYLARPLLASLEIIDYSIDCFASGGQISKPRIARSLRKSSDSKEKPEQPRTGSVQFSSFHSPWIICISTPTLLSLLPPLKRCVNDFRNPTACFYLVLSYTYMCVSSRKKKRATRGDCYNDHEFLWRGKRFPSFHGNGGWQ